MKPFLNIKSYRYLTLSLLLIAVSIVLLIPHPALAAPDLGNTMSEQIEAIRPSWKYMLSLVDYLIVAFLIFIAFTNILKIQIDVYTVKKTMPTLILAVVLANFSWFVCNMLIDFATVFARSQQELVSTLASVKQFPDGWKDSLLAMLYWQMFSPIFSSNVSIYSGLAIIGVTAAVSGVMTGGVLLAFIVGVVVISIPLLLFIAVQFLLFIRILVIDLLVIASPLAFLAIGFPLTQKLFAQWWSQFTKWVFMAPLVYLLWTLAIVIGDTFNSQDILGGIIRYAMICGALYFSLTVPFSLGGGIMSAWGGLGKSLGKRAGLWAGKSGISAFQNKFGWNPYHLVKGWQKGSEEGWVRTEAAGTGRGQDVREGVTSFPAQLDKLRKGEITAGELWKTQDRATMAILSNDLQLAQGFGHYDEDKLRDGLKKSSTWEEARHMVLALAEKGQLTEDDQKQLMRYGPNNGVNNLNEATLKKAEDLSLHSQKAGAIASSSILSKDDKGKLMPREDKDIVTNQAYVLERQYNNASTTKKGSVLRDAASYLTQEIANAKKLQAAGKGNGEISNSAKGIGQFLGTIASSKAGEKLIDDYGIRPQFNDLQQTGEIKIKTEAEVEITPHMKLSEIKGMHDPLKDLDIKNLINLENLDISPGGDLEVKADLITKVVNESDSVNNEIDQMSQKLHADVKKHLHDQNGNFNISKLDEININNDIDVNVKNSHQEDVAILGKMKILHEKNKEVKDRFGGIVSDKDKKIDELRNPKPKV